MTQIEPQPAVNPGLEAAIAGKTQRKVRSAKIQLEGVASSPASSNENHLPLVLHCFHLLLRLVDVWYLQALQAIFLNANKSQIKSEAPFVLKSWPLRPTIHCRWRTQKDSDWLEVHGWLSMQILATHLPQLGRQPRLHWNTFTFNDSTANLLTQDAPKEPSKNSRMFGGQDHKNLVCQF